MTGREIIIFSLEINLWSSRKQSKMGIIFKFLKDNCAKIVSSGRWQMKRTYARILNEAQDTACESLSAGRWETAAVERALVSRKRGWEEGININCSKHVNTCGENCAAAGLAGYWNSSTCIPNGPLFHQRHKLLGNSVEQSGSWTSLSLFLFPSLSFPLLSWTERDTRRE